jgi:hypothetical protein
MPDPQGTSEQAVIPAKAGIKHLCNALTTLDSGFRRNDGL